MGCCSSKLIVQTHHKGISVASHPGVCSRHSSGPLTDSRKRACVGVPVCPYCSSGRMCSRVSGPANLSILLLTLVLSLQGSEAASKGDFLFSSDHLIEMATKLYRTTLSQTKQKLNIEISDEYVHILCSTLLDFQLDCCVWFFSLIQLF